MNNIPAHIHRPRKSPGRPKGSKDSHKRVYDNATSMKASPLDEYAFNPPRNSRMTMEWFSGNMITEHRGAEFL